MENSLSPKANGAEIEAEITTETSLPVPARSFLEMSRRSLLRRMGITAATVSVLGVAEGSGLTLLPSRPGSGVAWAQTSTTPPPVDGGAKQQFPYYADNPWDQPQYYETIQAGRRMFPKTRQNADIDGDGRDEMIARGPGGIHVNRFNHDTGQWVPMPDGPPLTDAAGYDAQQYYSTIQFADINGDKKAEIVGNGPEGVFAYRYDLGTQKWVRLADGPKWSQSNGENFSGNQYSQTIQCGDFNGDGQDELVGRNSTAIEVWRYNQESNSWTHLQDGPAWSNAAGWDQPQRYQTIQVCDIYGRSNAWKKNWKYLAALDSLTFRGWISNSTDQYWHSEPGPLMLSSETNWGQPQYYQTIQTADIDGDGQDEVIARVSSGIMVWKYENITFTELAGIPDFKDSDGWGQPKYYQTIQTADIDGDGCEEVLGRGPDGMHVWKYEIETKSWRQMSTLTTWSDANGWDKVQHYATITSARVLKPGDSGYAGNGTHTQAVMMARGPLGMQTFRWISDALGWPQTSAVLPNYTDYEGSNGKSAAYTALNKALDIRSGGGYGEIRGFYNNETYAQADGRFENWQENLYDNPISFDQQPRPHCKLPLPDGVTQADWDEVSWQIYWEIEWVGNVYDWYGDNQAGSLLVFNNIAEKGALNQIRSFMAVSSDDSTAIAMSILALIGSMAAAILTGGASLGVEAGALGVASAVAGGLSSVFSAVPGFSSGSDLETTIKNLEDDLDTSFAKAVVAASEYKFALTGGYDPDNNNTYQAADYGRLKQIGQWVGDGTWEWATGSKGGDQGKAFIDAVNGYAKYAWQTIVNPVRWYSQLTSLDFGQRDLPLQYQDLGPRVGDNRVLVHRDGSRLPLEAFQALFDPLKPGSVFPLAVPVRHVYDGTHGWPTIYKGFGSTESIAPSDPLPALGVSIMQSVSLLRDPLTQDILVTVTLENKGLTPATNVEITDARLNLRGVSTIHMPRQKRLTFGHFETVTLKFPALTGRTGVLSIRGTYQGGTFGGTFRVPMP